MAKLVIETVTKSFGKKQLLKDIFFECFTGEIIGAFGRNGCGKSTLLKILFGTETADNFSGTLDGNTFIPKNNIADGHIAYLPQDTFLPKSVKVRDIVPLYFPEPEQQDKILYSEGIGKITNTRAGNLSLGEARYLELVMIGNLDHPFMMLDEPFSMIEPLYKELIKEFLQQLRLTKGIIATDHYYADILEVTNRNILLKDGISHPVVDRSDLAKHGYLPPS
ncbi:MAG: ATP-binding cassette domain-containing protein [Flavobacterium sp.]|nr:MAG: ATP-binding cassette domain-containing protein [Flavobacterium sp.]